MLKDPEINAVHVCTPNALHFPMAKAALEAGKHVLCEKPLATSVEEAQQMVDSVRRNGTPAWYLMAWNEGHGFFKPANVNFLYNARALFVKEYLLK